MSRLPFELFLALRYLRPKRTFVSVITLISVMGVMLGVAVLIIVLSVMTGFDRQLRDKIIGFNAHLTVFQYEAALENYPDVMRAVASNGNVVATSPFILGQVMLKTQPTEGKPRFIAPMMRGIDSLREASVSSLATNMVSGEFDVEGDGLLIGAEMARQLRLSVGDRVSIYSPRNLEEMEKHKGKENEVAILPDEFVVRGIFDVGFYEYNANVIIMSLRSAQGLYELPGKVHGLLVMLRDPEQAGLVRAELRSTMSNNFGFSIWTETNPEMLTALAVEKNVMFYLLTFIVIVAAFGIMNSQITFVVQKTREIGMMKALGATRGQIMAIFLGQSFVVGTFGVSAGLGLGLLLLKIRNEFLRFMNQMTGVELFPASIYSFTELPALTSVRDITVICVTALIICVLAGLVPAWSAGRLKPVEALRHE